MLNFLSIRVLLIVKSLCTLTTELSGKTPSSKFEFVSGTEYSSWKIFDVITQTTTSSNFWLYPLFEMTRKGFF